MLSTHQKSALEYWYFKVNSGPVALLVDWIERRKLDQHWLRVSIHSPGQRAVHFQQLSACMPADNFLDSKKTIGSLGRIRWDLNIDTGRERIQPDIFPAAYLRMPDLASVSAPRSTFTGIIDTGDEVYHLDQVAGMVSHYWGRQLAAEWWWIAAHQFDQPDVTIECCVLKSKVWGSRLSLPLAYLYLSYEGKSQFIVVPFNMSRVEGTLQRFHVYVRSYSGKLITLKCTGREYGDFGDNISNTLVGDLEVWIGNKCIGVARGTAGLERLFPRGEPLQTLKFDDYEEQNLR